ncbi:MAG: roadblock/LC7 domain-containing protein [Planctomycetes bacterium]|nr:roadblock/LC7 domain-containing protein [Planctomycetota bacterium]
MTQSRTQKLVGRLTDLQATSPDIEGSAIVSVDGLSIASALRPDIEEDRVSAMSAAMLSLGERIATELGRGKLDQVYIKGNNGYVILLAIGEDAVLTIMARKEAKLGLILLDMSRAAADLSWTSRPRARPALSPRWVLRHRSLRRPRAPPSPAPRCRPVRSWNWCPARAG